ncbi:IMP dehydrogenase, partial [Phocaeicola vulgatus]
LVGGLRAGMGYCGAANIEQLHDAKFHKDLECYNQKQHYLYGI